MTLSPEKPAQTIVAPRRFGMVRAILALLLREMTTTYGRSVGGYFWQIVEPVAGIALLTAAFSLFFRAPSLGISFPIFYATGILPYFAYQTMVRHVGQALAFSRPLLTYPSVTFIDAILARAALALMTQVVIFYVIITGIEVIYDTHTVHDYGAMVTAYAMAGALGLGIGTLHCFLITAFPDWERIWRVINKPMFIISAILYVVEDLPLQYQGYIWFNPLVHVSGMMRTGFYPTYPADYLSVIYVFGVSMTALVAGLFLLLHHHKRLLV